jgi:predicted amidohydrolase
MPTGSARKPDQGYCTEELSRMKDFRIGLIQCSPSIVGSRADNLALIETHLKQATENGADFVAFPEVTLTGYVNDPEEVRRRALSADSSLVRKAIDLSGTYSTYYSFGLFEKSGGDYFDTYLLVGRGRLIGSYRKIHVPTRERGLFTPGVGFRVFELPFVKVGFAICYDNEFCESHMCLALKGAELIVMPYAWAEHWEKEDYIERCVTDDEVSNERQRWMYMMFGARCRDTGTYSAMVDHSGIEAHGPWRFVGKSMIFAPTGRVMAETEGWNDEAIYADLNAQLLEDYRRMDCYVLKSREPDAYGPLVDKSLQVHRQD